jgi:hypothetical protein
MAKLGTQSTLLLVFRTVGPRKDQSLQPALLLGVGQGELPLPIPPLLFQKREQVTQFKNLEILNKDHWVLLTWRGKVLGLRRPSQV